MKKFLGLISICLLAFPGWASAESGQLGIYVAPKLVYGYTMMNKVVAHDKNLDTGEHRTISIGNKDEDAWGGSIAIGYDFSKRFDVPIRTELEYSAFSQVKGKLSRMDPDDDEWHESLKQKFGIQTLFLNAYFDIKTGTPITPYVGGGIGAAFINTKYRSLGHDINDPQSDWTGASTGNKTRTNFAWNVAAGLGYDITDYLTVDLGYRFVGLGSVKTSNGRAYDQDGITELYEWGKTKDLYMHQVALGLRVTF